MIQIFLLSAISMGRMFFYHQNLGIISNFLSEMKYDYLPEFEQYRSDYNRTYNDVYEHWYRYYIFEENYYHIQTHNGLNKGYSLAVNNFTDRMKSEIPKGYNGYPHFRNPNNYNYYRTGLNKLNYNQIDWRADGQVTNVKNQGQCGSCWAFSAVATIEGAHMRNTSHLVSLSEEDIVDCVPDCYGCGGGWPFMAIEYIMDGTVVDPDTNHSHKVKNFTRGVDTEASYPYTTGGTTCNFTTGNVGSLVNNLTLIPRNSTQALIDAVLRVGPISVAINAGGDFQMYSNGIYNPPDCDPTQIDHAVTVVGYGINEKGEKYFIVKNSWGTSWGMDGYIYMSADTPNLCGIAMDACFAS